MLARLFALALLCILLSGFLTVMHAMAGANFLTPAATPLAVLGLAALLLTFTVTLIRS